VTGGQQSTYKNWTKEEKVFLISMQSYQIEFHEDIAKRSVILPTPAIGTSHPQHADSHLMDSEV
jgi:hypothetical protein